MINKARTFIHIDTIKINIYFAEVFPLVKFKEYFINNNIILKLEPCVQMK